MIQTPDNIHNIDPLVFHKGFEQFPFSSVLTLYNMAWADIPCFFQMV